MIPEAFISAMLTNAAAPARRKAHETQPALIDRSVKAAAARIGRHWNDWAKIEPRLPESSLLGVYEGVNVWKLEPGIYLAEQGNFFKVTASLDFARVLASNICHKKALRRLKLKETK